MKPTCFRALCLAAVAFLPLPGRAAPGDLDLSFVPEVEPDTFGWIRPAGRQVYLYNFSARPVRLRDDGSLDDWTLAAPANSEIGVFGLLPWGGAYVSSGGRLYLETPEGTFTSVSKLAMTPWALHPLDDGSFIVRGSGGPLVSRYRPDHTLDPVFAERSDLQIASSPDGSILRTALDSAGRLILGGPFSAAGGIERLGLARLLPDGSVDPSWNPAPALGVTLTAQGVLTGIPSQMAVGGDDTVYLRATFVDENNLRTYRVLRISADGTVTGNFPADGYGYAAPVVQPDGKIVIIGSFGTWQGEPTPGIVRLNADGSRDASFAPQLGFPGNVSMGDAALDDRGRLLITGRFDSVNGVPRPGVARLFAFDPVETEPGLSVSASQPRIGTNEVLRLTAQVTGTPLPDLQWYRNGEPIPGATHRGLALPVTGGDSIGSFQLVASNALGTTTLAFPPVALARRSPSPVTLEPGFDITLTGFGPVREMVVQPDGRILVAGGSLPIDPNTTPPAIKPIIGRIFRDGSWDHSFGSNGIVMGRAVIEGLRILPDGAILAAGHLRSIGDTPVGGLAELDPTGQLIPRAFPALDVPRTTAALKLPDGGYILAGDFSTVDGQPALHLARLAPDLSVVTSFSGPVELWQVVDDLALDQQGRLLIAGSGIYPGLGGANPAPLGIWRLAPDGSPDPEFQHDSLPAQRLKLEPSGTILAGVPARRLSDTGDVLAVFPAALTHSSRLEYGLYSQDIRRRTVFSLDGGILHVARLNPSLNTPWELHRWFPSGAFDLAYGTAIADTTPINRLVAVELADQSLLLATFLTGDSRLLRIPPASDLRFDNVRLSEGSLRAELLTQPGRNYVVRQRATLNGPAGEPVAELTGDGYLQEVQAEAAGNTGFLELLRQ